MGRILVLLSLLSFNAMGAVPGNAPIVCIGAPGQQTQSVCVPLSQLSATTQQVFTLFGAVATTAANFYPFNKNGVAYQVTTGKTAYCFNLRADTSSQGLLFQLVSATVAITNAGAASITGGVHQGGAAGVYPMVANTTSYVPAGVPGIYTFAASTYPGYQVQSSFNYFVGMECFEQ